LTGVETDISEKNLQQRGRHPNLLILEGLMLNIPPAVADAVVPGTEQRAGGTIVVAVSGAVDGSRVRTVHRSVIDALRRHRPDHVDIGLSGCTMVDSEGMRGLRLCRTDAAQLDCRLAVVRAPVPVQRVLRGTGLCRCRPPPTCAVTWSRGR
jgi:anti-anti-sigma factor